MEFTLPKITEEVKKIQLEQQPSEKLTEFMKQLDKLDPNWRTKKTTYTLPPNRRFTPLT